MPTSSPVAILNLVETPNLRAAAPAVLGEKEDFQNLLDIGKRTVNKPERHEIPEREEHRDDRQEILAAPVEAPTQPVVETKPVEQNEEPVERVDGRDHENHDARAERRPAEHQEKTEAFASVRNERAKDVSAKPAEHTHAGKSTAAENADGSEEVTTDTADVLHNQVNVLRSVLELLQTLGENPAQAIAKIEIAILRATTVTTTATDVNETDAAIPVSAAAPSALSDAVAALTNALQEPVSSDTADVLVSATPTSDTPVTPNQLIQDILAQLKSLQAVLDNTRPGNITKNARPVFSQLVQALQALKQYMIAHPTEADRLAGNWEQAIRDTRSLIHQIKDKISAAKNVADTAAVDPLPPVSDTAASSTRPQAKILSFAAAETAAPVQPAVTIPTHTIPTSIATALAAAAETAADTHTDSSSQDNKQPAPQAILGVRDAKPTQSAQSANAPDFARLLQQVKVPVAEQVMFQIKTGLEGGSSKIHIQLDPAELGRVEIKLNVDANGKTGVSVTADNKNTLDLLQRDTRGLERALSDAGLKTDSGSLSFNLRGGQQEQNNNPSYAQPYLKALPEEPAIIPASVISRSYVLNVNDGLDIVI